MHLNDIGQWLSVSNITFLELVHAGDTVCRYTEVKRTGRTWITLDVEVWVLHQGQGERVKVTEPNSPLSPLARIAVPANLPDPSRRWSAKERDNRVRRVNLSGRPTGGRGRCRTA